MNTIRNRLLQAAYLLAAAALLLASLAPGGLRAAYAQEPALPFGSHDGVEGTVAAAGCSASGWAVDPDNRDRDLLVRILADGSPVATTIADQTREDVQECPGGTCGFGLSLWGLISAGVEHQITAQAYDEETSAWVDLGGTPKSLTCWGYPEGFHDGVEGTVDASGCAAFGWAVDLDNRDRDVLVQILSDGSPVSSLTASDYGEDMDQLGICPGGTCRFNVDLRDLITYDQEHQITAQAYDEETAAWMNLGATPKSLTCQAPPPPIPWLIAFPENEAVEGWEWPLGAAVHLTVDDPATEPAPDLERDGTMAVTTWGDPRTYVRFDFADAYGLKVGDVVTIIDGMTAQTHLVRNLFITAVNAAADTVAGTADPGTLVQVWPHGFDQTATVQVTVGEDGAWLADFAGLFDLVAGTGGRSQILDEAGNATAVDWSAPAPWFTAFPEGEVIEGWDWPLGAAMHLAIDDPATEASPDFEQDGTVVLAPWGSGQHWVWLDFGGVYDLKVGDVVTLTDGVTERTHVVQNLSITAVDANENTVTGMAEAGKNVNLWSWEDPQGRRLQVTADDSGAWVADFDDVGFDLVPDYHVRSEIWDEAGNDTAVDWTVSAPPPPPTPITHGMHVRLPADAGWTDSGIVVAAGVPINITATGQAITAPLKDYPDARSGPDGQITNCWDSCALDGAPYGALIGRIGLHGEPFVISSSMVLNPPSGDVLYLAVNDNDIYYGDNHGNYIVFFGQ